MEGVPLEAKRIIVAPLHWGLGHATRCIPLINQLRIEGKEVLIASDGEALELLKAEFPDLPTIALPAYKVKYKFKSLILIMMNNFINVGQAIIKEKRLCKAIVKDYNIDFIISDNRFGFRSKLIPSVIISHQLSPFSKNSLFRKFLELGNRYLLNKFDECWVPDSSNHTLSGTLSKNNKITKVRFLGPISRLKKGETQSGKYDLTIILSGPEPARTILELDLLNLLQNSSKKICLVRGTQQGPELSFPESWDIYQLADSTTINQLILNSNQLVSRSGYTSIMDYYHLGVGAYLIPTSGQTEQEYLAEYLDGKFGFIHLKKLRALLL